MTDRTVFYYLITGASGFLYSMQVAIYNLYQRKTFTINIYFFEKFSFPNSMLWNFSEETM